MDRPYPTLELIDRALADPARALAAAANAPALERRARALADAYWSERVWLTGLIPGPAFDRVAAELLALRVPPLAAGPLAVASPLAASAA